MIFNCIDKLFFLDDQVNFKEVDNNVDGPTAAYNQYHVLTNSNLYNVNVL